MRSTDQSHKEAATRDRIRIAAVELFAEAGINGVTTRALAKKAEVNTAAVNYHFGNKDNLTIEVFRDVARRTAIRRLESLDRVLEQASSKGEKPEIRDIVEAFIDAYVNEDDPKTGVLLAHLVLKHRLEPNDWTRAMVRDELDPMAKRYIAALAMAAPHLNEREVHWRYHIMMGAIQVMLSDAGPDSRMARLSGGLCDPSDRNALRSELVAFIVNAFGADMKDNRGNGV
tara:strand:+ start:64711 stop:65397 length:687 start_codon:yes stop_codon:yes gene_type:complete